MLQRAGEPVAWCLAGGMLALGIAAAGCRSAPVAGKGPSAAGRPPLTPEQVASMPLEPNVVRVWANYNHLNPWRVSEDKSRIRGIIVSALYLVGPHDRGVFGDGVIRPRLYVLEKAPDRTPTPRLVKEWSFDVNQAMPLRTKKQFAVGWGYWLPLSWGDLDLAGKEIRMIVAFERSDGVIVESGKKDFRVPLAAP